MPRAVGTRQDFQEVGIFLAPQYGLYDLVPIIEIFRIANQNAGRRLFNWSFVSENGNPVEAGAGMSLSVDSSIYSDFTFDLIFILACNDPISFLSKRLVSWIQRQNAHGVIIAGVNTGAFAIADAGLLNGRRATCHWEALPLFSERYPDVEAVERRYVLDLPILTCAGGISVLDMLLNLIEREHGPVLAGHVANGLVYPGFQRSDAAQRAPIGAETSERADPVKSAIALMEINIESPLPIDELATQVKTPRRNLEREFRRKTQSSIGEYYLRVRLERAREMLFYSKEAISEISLLCGFSSPAVFSRTFRQHFSLSPSDFRASFSAAEMARFRPHVTWTLSRRTNPG
ncbi:MAG: GlxA family transcriptional regulator [Rhodobacteraceae bacterium]|nr:GlxA family transcriptional regulator [Paracoccaceae bacterium]